MSRSVLKHFQDFNDNMGWGGQAVADEVGHGA